MPRPRLKRLALRTLLILGALLLVAAIGFGIGYLTHGWRRLDTLPTPDVALAGAFRPYAEHGDVPGGNNRPYVVRIDPATGDGALLFFGSGHTRDPDDPQIAQIVDAWRAFGPTLALCESRLGLYIGGLRRGVAMFGEIGAPFVLARDDDVPVFSLEPSWEDEIAVMLRDFDRQEVAAFYVLRGFTGERAGRTGDDLDDLAAHLLGKRANLPGLEGSFADLAAFDAWWDATLREEIGEWRTMRDRAMWPGVEPPTLLTRLANASSRARDEHMAKLIIDRVRAGERVFVVCGASHALTIEPVLWAGLGEAGG